MTVSLGDLKNEHGTSAYYSTDQLTNRLARSVADRLTTTKAFQRLSEIVGYHHAWSFFLIHCKPLIWPLARAHTVAGHFPVGDLEAHERAVTTDPVLYTLLQEACPSTRVELELESTRLNVRKLGKRVLTQARRFRLSMPSRGGCVGSWDKGTLAVECNQLDVSRKSVPFRFKTIPAERTLLCCLHPNYPMRKAVLAEYEDLGVRWVSLARNAVEGTGTNWRPGPLRGTTVARYRTAILDSEITNDLEHWVARLSLSLLSQVDYWQAFFSQHNVRVLLLRSGGPEEKIAKRIASALLGVAMVASQRSHYAARGNAVGAMTADVVFCWGDPNAAVGQDNENYNDHLVITGFSGEAAFDEGRAQGQFYRSQLTQAGARFIIGLFDNGYQPNSTRSRSTMILFYRHFLTWVLDGQDRGLVIKPKRDYIPPDLSEVGELLAAAEASGRCLVLSEEVGPQDVAFSSDLCVGIGHSTAVVISAIAGCRAVHCDLSVTPNHHLETWGLGRVLFHDLETLDRAIESHLRDPNESVLGDFTPVMDDLDPFRDGGATDRTEAYISWLLEAFDGGLDRAEALQEASSKYAATWGADKVISLDPSDLARTTA